MNDCLFCKIIDGSIPTKKLYEDDICVAFNDSNPQAPTHFLVVPKKHLASAVEITDDDATMVGHIFAVISLLTQIFGISDGYRVVTNCGAKAGQSVQHLHFHVLAGKELGSFN
ncbi:MAG: histidine triad nucleotide-binding protein [Oscillospiraceae bacterium]|nr:histidine triad nucleotide-binding protein [Oscillospiraceae bacterium]